MDELMALQGMHGDGGFIVFKGSQSMREVVEWLRQFLLD